MAEELGLPIKKIEVCVNDGDLIYIAKICVHVVDPVQTLVIPWAVFL